MIQLKDKRIIILALVVLLSISIFVIKKGLKDQRAISNKADDAPGRLLNNEEKQMVGIGPGQEAELVNKKEGLFIYKVVK